MKTSTPLGVLDMIPLRDFFKCNVLFRFSSGSIVEQAVDIDSTVGSNIDLMKQCNS
jgi:hypothetical protein